MQNVPCSIHRAQIGCIDMAACILKEMRILAMKRVGSTGFTKWTRCARDINVSG